MQLRFDWLIVLENLRRGIMFTDMTLEGLAGPRIIYVNTSWLKMNGYGRDELANQTPRYRKRGEPFLMNWYCYAIYGERPKPIYYVAEQEDVTELEALRMKQRLLVNQNDADAVSFFRRIGRVESQAEKGLSLWPQQSSFC